MPSTKALRREIERIFVPFVRSRGFAEDRSQLPLFHVFRRNASSVVEVVEVQWEKTGRPRFVINFGTCPAAGISIQGRHYAASDVFAGWLPDAGRLQPHKGALTTTWFRQDRPLLQRLIRPALRPPNDVMEEAIGLFGELESYWSSGELGPHLRTLHPLSNRGHR